jgi:hypothetical protein
MSEPTSVVGVENKEECNKSAGSTASGRSQEAAVNKKEGRYKQQTWRHAYDVWRWAEREDENVEGRHWKNWRDEDEDEDDRWAISDEDEDKRRRLRLRSFM